jgi:acyl dehydratase
MTQQDNLTELSFTPRTPRMGSHRERIGVEVKGEPFTVTAEIAQAYAAATDDGNRSDATIAPPMSAVIYALSNAMLPAALPAIGDPMRLMKLLHGEQEIRWLRPVMVGETLQNVGSVKAITDKGSGELLEVQTRALDATGATVVDMTWGLFIRASKKDQKPDQKPEDKPAAKPDRGAPTFEVSWKVAADQSLRYAEASGDRNPIHTDDAMAKMAGLDGKILHGLATMAFASIAVVSRAAAGDPARLKRLKVRFTKPVYPGDTLTASAWQLEKTGGHTLYALEVRTQAGVVVLESGSAEIA